MHLTESHHLSAQSLQLKPMASVQVSSHRCDGLWRQGLKIAKNVMGHGRRKFDAFRSAYCYHFMY